MTGLFKGLHNIIRRIARSLRWRSILTFLFMAFFAGYLIACLLAPGQRIRQLNLVGNREADLPERQKSDAYNPASMADAPGLDSLVREWAYLESRIEMARTDSIGMCINLRDSIMTLEIEGIAIHRARIERIRLDRFFRGLTRVAAYTLFSDPLIVEHEQASLAKEPVIVLRAPRDTMEAKLLPTQPDTLLRKPAYISLELSPGIHLVMIESSHTGTGGPIRKFFFELQVRSREAIQNTIAIASLKVPLYRPEIRIFLSGDDITTAYRALYGKIRIAILI
jgi:hypothetical protein